MTTKVPASAGPAAARKRGLHLDEIVAAAIVIADADGLEALSMRRVAELLGHGVMSLYRHVKDKDHLMALAADAVFAEEAFPDPAPGDWRGRMRESAHRQWRCYLRHPWIVSLVSLARPRIGPNGMRETEWAFEGLQELDIDDSERLHVYLVVTAFVHGSAAQAVAEAAAERASGLVAREWWSAQSTLLGEILATGRYPLISRLGPGTNASPGAWFDFGLDCLLDGLQLKVRPDNA